MSDIQIGKKYVVYAACVVCGEYKRILGRGACAGHYQAYRRMGWLDKLPLGIIGRPKGHHPEQPRNGLGQWTREEAA
jgi:hypothetical protein